MYTIAYIQSEYIYIQVLDSGIETSTSAAMQKYRINIAALLQIDGILHQEALTPPRKLSNVDSTLKKIKRRVDVIASDGNCFFRAVSKEILGSQSHHLAIRHHVTQLVLKNIKTFQPYLITGPGRLSGDLNFHCKAMSLSGTWATNLEILATSTLFGISIYLYTNDNSRGEWQWLVHRPLQKSSILFHQSELPIPLPYSHFHLELLYIPRKHFERIAPLNESGIFMDFPPLSDSEETVIID